MDFYYSNDAYYDFLVGNGIATREEIDLVTTILGYNEETMDKILFARTGYRDLEQIETVSEDEGLDFWGYFEEA